MAIGVVRTIKEFAASEWAKDWGAIRMIDDRVGGTVQMPGPLWRFSSSVLPQPGIPAFQGEDNVAILTELGLTTDAISDLKSRGVIRSRRAAAGSFE
jgi:CoA:oxalate CoA-transferase